MQNSERLNNLYLLARRARDNHDFKKALQLYEQIQSEAPNDWEAAFCVPYFSALKNYNNDKMGTALNTIRNCIDNVFDMVKKNVEDEVEQRNAALLIHDGIMDSCEVMQKEIEKRKSADLDDIERARRDGADVIELSKIQSEVFQVRGSGILIITEIYTSLGFRLLDLFDELSDLGKKAIAAIHKAEHLVRYYTNYYLKTREQKDIVARYERQLAVILEVHRKRRFDEYWEIHHSERIELESEKQSLNEQIAALKEEIALIPQKTDGYNHMIELKTKVKNLISEKKALGLFAFFSKEKREKKKKIRAQIDSANAEIAPIQARIDFGIEAVQKRITPLQNKVDNIIIELTKPR